MDYFVIYKPNTWVKRLEVAGPFTSYGAAKSYAAAYRPNAEPKIVREVPMKLVHDNTGPGAA